MPYYPRLDENGRFPTTVLIYPVEETGWHLHQKPVPLLKRLIELYTLPGDIVCDPCMGSGAVGVAALQLRRSFIGIEKHQPFFEQASATLYAERKILLAQSREASLTAKLGHG